MGNCLSKIPEGEFQLYKEAMDEIASYNKGNKGYIRRYDDLRAIGCHVWKLVCKTPVAARFPPQACNLEWGIKASRHIDRITNGKRRDICGMI